MFDGAAVSRTVTYIGKDFERRAFPGGPDHLVHYIRARGTVVAEVTKLDDANPNTDRTRYLHRDHLGSVALVTDEAGNVAEDRSFGPWGEARNADWSTPAEPPPLLETPRGFTGHEHLVAVGLIHMNGRVYDPKIGRFMSPDPSDALNPGVGFNRYAYVLNNPVSLVDPSGYCAGACVAAGFGLLGVGIGIIHEAWNSEEGQKLQKDLKNLNKALRSLALAPLPAATVISENSTEDDEGTPPADDTAAQDGESDPEKDLLDRTRPVRETKGGTKIRETEGGIGQANKDFDGIVDPDKVKDQGDGKCSGEMPNGNKVNVRPGSTDGRPTLEIRRPSGRGIEIRYNPEEIKENEDAKEDKSK